MDQRSAVELAHLAAIVDSSDDAILTKDLNGTIKSWNPAAERMYGYSAAEIVGRSIAVLVPKDRPGEVEGILRRISAGERVQHFETVRVAKDGRRLAVSLTISPVRDAEGNVRGASTIARDITGLLAERAALEEQAELLDIAQDAILARDLSGRITYWNRTAELCYGWTKEEAMGRNGHELLRTEFPRPLSEIESQLLSSGRWEGEVVHTTRTGAKLTDESRWVVRRDPSGKAFQVLEINNDITERKAVQAALAEREALLSTIFHASPDIVAVVNAQLELLYVNAAASEILGYELRELLNEDSLKHLHPDDVQVAADLLETAFGEDESASGRVRALASDGRSVVLDLRIRRMGDSGRLVVLARDVSDQVRFEAELREAREQAETANRAKSEFLSRMSHELRTPLNSILGFGQLLELDDLTPRQRESVEQIVKGGRRLLELINEVLDLARVESGMLRLSLEPVAVGDVVRESVDLLRPLAVERGIDLRIEAGISESDHYVVADRQRLGQVLLNLLANAVKYNVEHGTVSITAVRSNSRVRIGVTDTGPGVPSDKIPLLFTPFERLGAENTLTEGTGLGLTLSKRLVEAMGGQLYLDPMTGQGSAFWAEFDAIEPPPQSKPASSRAPAATPNHPVGKVLYIEDNASNLMLMEHLVGSIANLELISAMTGSLGLDLARQHRPELILLDLHLPDTHGDELLIKLRKDPKTKEIPIVVVSADATAGEIRRLRAVGADDYVTKPINVPAFLEVLERFLKSAAAP